MAIKHNLRNIVHSDLSPEAAVKGNAKVALAILELAPGRKRITLGDLHARFLEGVDTSDTFAVLKVKHTVNLALWNLIKPEPQAVDWKWGRDGTERLYFLGKRAKAEARKIARETGE